MPAPKTEFTTILYAAAPSGVCTITLNRPEVFNAFNEAMKVDLAAALRQAERDPAVRCLVLRGAGEKAFCSGQDLKEHAGANRSLKASLEQHYNPIVMSIRSMPKPVVGMINGVAAGAGCSLALACDMRFMSEKAKLIEVFVRIGLIPDSGSHWFLPRMAGMAKAFEWCATGRDIGAREAEQFGLVNGVFAPESLEAETMNVATALAAAPTRAIGYIKRTLNRALDSDLPSLLAYEAIMQEAAAATADHREGVTAFLEKRPAKFTGS